MQKLNRQTIHIKAIIFLCVFSHLLQCQSKGSEDKYPQMSIQSKTKPVFLYKDKMKDNCHKLTVRSAPLLVFSKHVENV